MLFQMLFYLCLIGAGAYVFYRLVIVPAEESSFPKEPETLSEMEEEIEELVTMLQAKRETHDFLSQSVDLTKQAGAEQSEIVKLENQLEVAKAKLVSKERESDVT